MKKLFLVTGGGGFIGSHLTRALVARGERVRVLDDLSGCRSWERLEDLGQKIERVVGSITDTRTLDRALGGVEVILHEAALVSVPESVANPITYHDTNASATLKLLEAARRAGTRRVIYASTSAIYGDGPDQPKAESMRGIPLSPYGIAKYVGELYVTAYAKLHSLETISLRYFNVFGPWQDSKSQYGAAIPNIVSKILDDKPPIIYGDGEQTRDFCHVNNVIHANLLAADARSLCGEVVNIGCGRRVTVNRIVQLTNELLGKSVKPKYESARPGDVRDSVANISAAKQVLGYEPVMHFDDGLQQAIEWYVGHHKPK